MQQFHEYQGPEICIVLMNQAYERNKDTLKPKSADADKVIQQCQDQLRQHQIKFHLAPCGEWIIDKAPCPILDQIERRWPL